MSFSAVVGSVAPPKSTLAVVAVRRLLYTQRIRSRLVGQSLFGAELSTIRIETLPKQQFILSVTQESTTVYTIREERRVTRR